MSDTPEETARKEEILAELIKLSEEAGFYEEDLTSDEIVATVKQVRKEIAEERARKSRENKIWTGPEGRMLVVKTESGARYEFRGRLMTKYASTGDIVDVFKAYAIKAVPADIQTMADIYAIPESYPEIGKLLYVSGYEAYWLSTPVVSVEEVDVEKMRERQNES